MENITFICRFCGSERKNGNSLRNHERLCKGNPNRQRIEDYTRNEKWYEAMRSFRRNGGTRIQVHPSGDFTCSFCGQSFSNKKLEYKTQHENHCKKNPNRVEYKNTGTKVPEETKKRWKQSGRMGGYRKGAGRGKKGYYKGLYCMSTWELAWVVYQLEHGQKVEQCRERFEYIMNEEVHHYTPDFIIDGIYYEIKNWHRPDTDFKVSQFPKDKTLILIEGKEQNKTFLEYAKNKYGTNFDEVLYEKC